MGFGSTPQIRRNPRLKPAGDAGRGAQRFGMRRRPDDLNVPDRRPESRPSAWSSRKVAAAFGAMCATGLLGCALALFYLVAERNLAPCIISHMMINLFVEPGLVLAAVRGEKWASR